MADLFWSSNHDNRFGVRRYPVRGLGMQWIRRKGIQRFRAGDAHQMGAEPLGVFFDFFSIHEAKFAYHREGGKAGAGMLEL